MPYDCAEVAFNTSKLSNLGLGNDWRTHSPKYQPTVDIRWTVKTEPRELLQFDVRNILLYPTSETQL